MIPWTVVTTRPPRLSNNVGQGGLNAKHDVALMQAMLANVRSSRGGIFYDGQIDGRLSDDTVRAMMLFREDQRGIGPPMAPWTWHASDPSFQALAQQSPHLSVIEGTTTAYFPAMGSAPPRIDDQLEPVKLDDATSAKLKAIAEDLHRTTGIAFDIALAARKLGPDVTAAQFQPKDLAILTATGSRQKIGRAEDLKHTAADLLKVLEQIAEYLIGQKLGRVTLPGTVADIQDPLMFAVSNEADRTERRWKKAAHLPRWRQRCLRFRPVPGLL